MAHLAGVHERIVSAAGDIHAQGFIPGSTDLIDREVLFRATRSLNPENRRQIAEWPDCVLLDTPRGTLLLCHGTPESPREPLFESLLDSPRVVRWLDAHSAAGLVCARTGLPWVHSLPSGRFAANCGAVGLPDHDGDTAVHYLRVELAPAGHFEATLRRVEYEVEGWARHLEEEGVHPAVVQTLRTGCWTVGLEALPPRERQRPSEFGASPK